MSSKLLIKYTNKWVALTSDRKKVVASAQDIRSLDQQVKKLPKSNDFIYHHVLPINGYYSPKWQK